MSPDRDAAVRVRDLRMRYGATDVLHGVDFDVQHGEVVCLLGPNGAGKTTTIEILEGFRTRSAGQVAVLGVDPAHGDEDWRSRTGVVLQSWRDHARWTPRLPLAHLGRYYEPYSTPQRPAAGSAPTPRCAGPRTASRTPGSWPTRRRSSASSSPRTGRRSANWRSAGPASRPRTRAGPAP